MQDLEKFKNDVNLSGKNVYVGNRYVPKMMGEWSNNKTYEPLSVVTYQGASYTSRQYVPTGVEITNEDFWALSGNYNEQVERYRQEVITVNKEVKTGLKNVNDEVANARNGESTLNARLDKEQDEVNEQLAQTAQRIYNNLNMVKNDFVNTKFIAHRGVSQFAPENSIPAFKMAADMGFYGIETDVLKTADGKWIVFHDKTFDRMTDGTGTVIGKTLAEIKSLNIDAGNGIAKYENVKIPTLEEFLEFCNEFNIVPMLEAKFIFSDVDSAEFVSLMKKYNLENRCIVVAYQTSTLESVRKYSDKIRLMWILESWSDENIGTMIDKKIDGCSLSYSVASKAITDLCHVNELMVSAFTFNTQHYIRDKKNLNLDFILSDFINGEVR